METLRVGVIGTGMMGCEHIRNVVSNPRMEVVAIADPNQQSQRWAAEALAGVSGDVRSYSGHLDLIESGGVDALIVASPNHTHHGILLDVLATEIPVLVEKPMCTTVEDCLEVVRAAESRAAVTWVGLEYRYMPAVAALLAEVASGSLGVPRMMAIREHRFPFLPKVDNWNRFDRNTGGTLVEKCCHFFDLMNLALGSRPTRVVASGGQDVNHLDESYDGERPDILDNAYVIVDYESGARAMLDLSMFAEGGRHEQEIVVVGDCAKAEAMIPGPDTIFVGDRTSRKVREIDVPVEPVGHTGFHHGASWREVEHFRVAVVEGRRPEVGVVDGLWSVAVGAAAHESIRSGRSVTIDLPI